MSTPPHKPDLAILTCADARIDLSKIAQFKNKSIFEVRVAGNLVDTHAIASLEFAVGYLTHPAREIMILGHSDCGAVETAQAICQCKVSQYDLTPSLQQLVTDIIPAFHLPTGQWSLKQLTKQNIRFSKEKLLAGSKLIRDRAASSSGLKVKMAYLDLKTNKIVPVSPQPSFRS